MNNVKSIIQQYLIDNGYDGLCSGNNGCGCWVNDLIPCEGCFDDCVPGYETKCLNCETPLILSGKDAETNECEGC